MFQNNRLIQIDVKRKYFCERGRMRLCHLLKFKERLKTCILLRNEERMYKLFVSLCSVTGTDWNACLDFTAMA